MARSTATTSARALRAGGFTLAESLIASVVLAIAIVAIAGSLAASYQQNTLRGNRTTAITLAQQLMEEIAAKPIEPPAGQTDKPGWPQGQTDRRQYDTLDDYNGYTDLSSTIQAADGSTIDLGDGSSYQRSVAVQSGARPPGLTGRLEDFVMVTVTVTMPHNQTTSVSQLFTRVTRMR